MNLPAKCHVIGALFSVLTLQGCVHHESSSSEAEDVGANSATAFHGMDQHRCDTQPAPPYQPSAETRELDAIYSLLAFSVVYKDWQDAGWDQPDRSRGYNIGGILVDPAKPEGDQILCWSRNTVIRTRNGTQHGEVRLITNFLNNSPAHNLKGLKLYTTLEPCAMCSGMMTLQRLETTVYGQTDPAFGAALERLSFDLSEQGGFCPYPRAVQSVKSDTRITRLIDESYKRRGGSIVDWLASDEAKALYELALEELENFEVKYRDNLPALEESLNFLDVVPDSYTSLPYSVACE